MFHNFHKMAVFSCFDGQVGFNDAFPFVRCYGQLSDGQKYRFRIAKLIETGKQFWVMDEFCATLDRDTARIVAYNLQKLAGLEGKAVLVATTHTDLFEDLKRVMYVLCPALPANHTVDCQDDYG